jgi:hypothetical protein
MKLVRGRTLAALLRERKDPQQDLARFEQIFEQVCQTMAYAHSRGVIHRDLKPSNIMVGAFGEVQVMDWGLAKVLTGADAAPPAGVIRTVRSEGGGDSTEPGWVAGTPAYMAPEQTAGEPGRLDQRCDVFGLGAILCEILTGEPPYGRAEDAQALFKAARADLAEAYARLDACGADVELIHLARTALAAEPRDRPRDAGVLAAGMAAYRESLATRLQQAGLAQAEARARAAEERKRRRLVLGLAAVVLLIALLATWQAVRATRAEATARSAEQEAVQAQQAETDRAEGERLAKLDAQAQKANAEQAAAAEKSANAEEQKRLRQVEKANDILTSIFENLDPREIARAGRPLQAILVEKLDKAVAQLEGESIGDSLVVATMQDKFGRSLLGLGEPGKAIVLLEKARATRQANLGPKHLNTLRTMNNLAGAYQAAGKLDLALPLYQETLQLTKGRLGPEDTDTLRSMNNLAGAYQAAGKLDLALPLYQEAFQLTKAKLGPEHPHTVYCMNNLAGAYQDARKLDLALPLFKESLQLTKARLGPEHPDTFYCMNNLASAYHDAGKLDLALPLFKETLKLRQAKLGPEHPDTLQSMSNLAGAYQDAGKPDLGLPLYQEALQLMRAKLGPEHPITVLCINNLATAYWQGKQFDKSIPLLEQTLKRQEAKFGRDNLDTLRTVGNLGVNYKDAGRLKEALPLLEEAYRGAKKYPNLRGLARPLLEAYAKASETAKFVNLLQEQLPAARQALPRESPQLAGLLAQIGQALLQQKKWAEAEPHLRECLAIRVKAQPDAWNTFNAQSMLGGALLGQKKYAAAEPLLLAGYEGMKKQEAKIPPQGKARLIEAVERLVQLYEATDKKDEATKWRKELEAVRTAATKPQTKP